MAITIETVNLPDFSMDYFRFGKGERTFVILPGLSVQSVMGAAEAIAAEYRPLTEDYTVYVFDRRKELPPVYTVADMARDTATAMEALFGWLYLNGKTERLNELFAIMMED